ncbi:MAG: NUDIX domain-containing protein [Planctomycetia bacterium]|nr:NUDIX domain-containing protein [Planctomycetia bacterium]
MAEVKSCGIIVFRRHPLEFLLMRHPTRWDLPKGHVDPGETNLECALRELREETGIGPEDIQLDEKFLFEHHYPVRDRSHPDRISDKTLLIYLGWLKRNVDVVLTEHEGFAWFPWAPPHAIQAQTIDPLLAAIAAHWQ